MSHSGASKKSQNPSTTDNLKELLKNLRCALQSDESITQEAAADGKPPKAKFLRKSSAQALLLLNYKNCFRPAELDWDPHSAEALELPLAALIEQVTKEDVKNWAYHVAYKLGSKDMISENHPDLEKTVNGQTVKAWLQSVNIQPKSQVKKLRIQVLEDELKSHLTDTEYNGKPDLTNKKYKDGFNSKERFELEQALFHNFQPISSTRAHRGTPTAASTPRPHFASSSMQLISPRFRNK